MAATLRPPSSALLAAFILLAFPLQPPAPALAASPAVAVLAGSVTTLDGKVRLPGVVITLTGLDGSPVGETVTDEQGAYRLEAPRTGTYRVKTSIEGFHPTEQNVELKEGTTRVVDLDLRLLEIEQRVDVTPTNDTPLNLAKPLSPAESIDGKAMSASAVTSGSVAAELRWMPGVAPYGREWGIKGGRPNQIGMQVETAQAVDPASGTSPIQLPGDAVNSIQVLANPYSVEFGRFSTGLIVVSTRTGVNKWTATVNDILPGFIVKRGSNPFAIIGLESFSPRVALGGPLVKNKLFLAESAQPFYDSSDVASRPQDQRRVTKGLRSFTRLDWVVNPHNTLSGTFTLAPQSTQSANLSTFDPPETAADLSQRVYRAGLTDTAQLPHAMVMETLAYFTHYGSGVDGQGPATEMVLAPEGNSGIYYARQDRKSEAWQVSAALSKFVNSPLGQHLFKAGVDAFHASYSGQHDVRPIDILREDGTLTRRLTAAPSHLTASSTDVAGFVQDRWHISDYLLVELGLRIERDGVFDHVNLIPRFGAAIALDKARKATVRGGWGYFYERTPTLAGAFGQLSDQFETAYAADGQTPLGPPVQSVHSLEGPLSTPRSVAWNVGYEHRIAPWLSIRANHLERNGYHELILDAGHQGTSGHIELETTGTSRYRDTEVGARFQRGTSLDVDVSYTHSEALADLNDAYGYYLNLTAYPVVRGNQYGPTDTDSPDRFLARGRALIGKSWTVELAGELRTGTPWSAVDEQLEFVGPRNSRRFPLRKVLDVAFERRFRIGRLEPWIGLVFINALNNFNPVDVQRNVASPAFGYFYAGPVRQVRVTIHFH